MTTRRHRPSRLRIHALRTFASLALRAPTLAFLTCAALTCVLLTFTFPAFGDPASPGEKAREVWRFQAAGQLIAKPTIAGEQLYLAGGETVHVLDLEGKELWRRTLPGTIAARVRVLDDTVYVHSSAGLHALDSSGANLFWTFELADAGPLVDGRTWGWGAEILADPWGWYRSAPLVDGDAVVIGTDQGVHAVAKDTGEPKWQVPIGPVTADPLVYEDLIIVAGWNHSVYGLERASGKVRWRFRAQVPFRRGVDWIGYQGFHVTPVLDGDRLFVGNRNTYFYALDADDGTEAWSSKVGASWIGSPAVTSDDSVYYGLSDGKAVLGHRKDSGALTLFFNTGSIVFAQPELHGKRLIVGTLSGHLFAVDRETGEGHELTRFGPAKAKYEEFFDPKNLPDGLSIYEANRLGIERMLTESNSILNLTIHADVAYVGTASGRLYALALE